MSSKKEQRKAVYQLVMQALENPSAELRKDSDGEGSIETREWIVKHIYPITNFIQIRDPKSVLIYRARLGLFRMIRIRKKFNKIHKNFHKDAEEKELEEAVSVLSRM